MHRFHMDSVRDVLHVLTAEMFLLHSAAECFVNESLQYFGDDKTVNVAFFFRKIRLRTPTKQEVFATAQCFKTHKVCHSNRQSKHSATYPSRPTDFLPSVLALRILGGHVASPNQQEGRVERA